MIPGVWTRIWNKVLESEHLNQDNSGIFSVLGRGGNMINTFWNYSLPNFQLSLSGTAIGLSGFTGSLNLTYVNGDMGLNIGGGIAVGTPTVNCGVRLAYISDQFPNLDYGSYMGKYDETAVDLGEGLGVDFSYARSFYSDGKKVAFTTYSAGIGPVASVLPFGSGSHTPIGSTFNIISGGKHGWKLGNWE